MLKPLRVIDNDDEFMYVPVFVNENREVLYLHDCCKAMKVFEGIEGKVLNALTYSLEAAISFEHYSDAFKVVATIKDLKSSCCCAFTEYTVFVGKYYPAENVFIIL